jgi:hypothetical protein
MSEGDGVSSFVAENYNIKIEKPLYMHGPRED